MRRYSYSLRIGFPFKVFLSRDRSWLMVLILSNIHGLQQRQTRYCLNSQSILHIHDHSWFCLVFIRECHPMLLIMTATLSLLSILAPPQASSLACHGDSLLLNLKRQNGRKHRDICIWSWRRAKSNGHSCSHSYGHHPNLMTGPRKFTHDAEQRPYISELSQQFSIFHTMDVGSVPWKLSSCPVKENMWLQDT